MLIICFPLFLSPTQGFMDRYLGSQNEAAVREYCKIAKEVSQLYNILRLEVKFETGCTETCSTYFYAASSLTCNTPDWSHVSSTGVILVFPPRARVFHNYWGNYCSSVERKH